MRGSTRSEQHAMAILFMFLQGSFKCGSLCSFVGPVLYIFRHPSRADYAPIPRPSAVEMATCPPVWFAADGLVKGGPPGARAWIVMLSPTQVTRVGDARRSEAGRAGGAAACCVPAGELDGQPAASQRWGEAADIVARVSSAAARCSMATGGL